MIRFPTSFLNAERGPHMASARARLNEANAQVSSGQKADRLSELHQDLRTYLNAEARSARAAAQAEALKSGETRLAITDVQLAALSDAVGTFRSIIEAALATRQSPGLQSAATALLTQLKTVSDTEVDGDPLFAPGAKGPVLLASGLSELAAFPSAADAFAPPSSNRTVALDDVAQISTALPAEGFGAPVAEALRRFHMAAVPPGTLSPTAEADLNDVLGLLAEAEEAISSAQALTGQRQKVVEAAINRQQQTADGQKAMAAQLGDVDMAEAVARLQNEQALMQASYRSVLSLQGLRLTDYI